MNSKNKRGAMEMTMGTVVTIVLLVAVLVVVLFFINKVRDVGVGAIEGIDQSIRNQIAKSFADDPTKKIVVEPPERIIQIKKGESNLGFGFSIRNIETSPGSFSYEVRAEETSCPSNLSPTQADGYISLGKTRTAIAIAAGSIMEDPVFIRFNIPDTAPPCQVRYSINVQRDNRVYGSSVDVDLFIQGK